MLDCAISSEQDGCARVCLVLSASDAFTRSGGLFIFYYIVRGDASNGPLSFNVFLFSLPSLIPTLFHSLIRLSYPILPCRQPKPKGLFHIPIPRLSVLPCVGPFALNSDLTTKTDCRTGYRHQLFHRNGCCPSA
jgi:hypothetical protein